MKRVLTLALVLFACRSAYAQQAQDYLELLRSDVQTQRVAIVTEVMEFDQAESDKFWPVFRDYEHEMTKIGDKRIALIRDYAAAYETMTDAKAKELIDRAFAIDQERLALEKKYYGEFEKAVGSATAAKFMQVDNQINLLVDLQISQALPLVKKPDAAANPCGGM